MAKPFLTYEQQLHTLSVNKKLIINDKDSASQALHDIGYFSLIGGYKSPFINPMSRIYGFTPYQNFIIYLLYLIIHQRINKTHQHIYHTVSLSVFSERVRFSPRSSLSLYV
jgi:hypothetical protein